MEVIVSLTIATKPIPDFDLGPLDKANSLNSDPSGIALGAKFDF
jgi:hypothetical protein